MAYCTTEDVKVLFGDVSDDIPEDLLDRVIENSTAWVDNKLLANHIPIPETAVDALTTAASYYSASQLLNSLDHGDDRIENHNDWYIMAKEFIEDYIVAYNNSQAEDSDLVSYQMVKHSHGCTYNQKRGRRGVRGWVR